jgi:hypothetical protein
MPLLQHKTYLIWNSNGLLQAQIEKILGMMCTIAHPVLLAVYSLEVWARAHNG